MLCRTTTLSCGLLMLATTAYAVQGDPLPGIDVSMEQSPGGIIAQGTTNSSGSWAVDLKPGSYRAVAKLAGTLVASPSKTAVIALTITPKGGPANVIRFDAAWNGDATVGIEFKTAALSKVSATITEGKPAGATPDTTAAPVCIWASMAYSQGAIFCMGPETAIECLKAPEWVAKKYPACDRAVPIAPR